MLLATCYLFVPGVVCHAHAHAHPSAVYTLWLGATSNKSASITKKRSVCAHKEHPSLAPSERAIQFNLIVDWYIAGQIDGHCRACVKEKWANCLLLIYIAQQCFRTLLGMNERAHSVRYIDGYWLIPYVCRRKNHFKLVRYSWKVSPFNVIF